jgi:hypothetical protein
MAEFIVRDVRLHGWKPAGDTLEVNFDTPLQWVIDNIKNRASNDLVVKFMCHGLPGFLIFANGATPHPTAGNGISLNDLAVFSQLKGKIKRLEFHACLVARIGSCFECNGHQGYDGNNFCYRMAQTIGAEVKASIHLQYYQKGHLTDGTPMPGGINFSGWNGRVFTWNADGSIQKMEDFPYND